MIFSFLLGKICAPKKSGACQGFCAPERARSASGTQFVQAYITKNYISEAFFKFGLISAEIYD